MSHCFIDLVTLSELALEAMLSCVMTKWSLVNNVLQMVHTHCMVEKACPYDRLKKAALYHQEQYPEKLNHLEA